MKIYLLSAAAFLLILGGCAAQGPKNPLSAATVDDFKVSEIVVEVPQSASIRWGTAEEDYARSKGCERPSNINSKGEDRQNHVADPDVPDCDYFALVETPEAKAYLRDRLEREVATAMQGKFGNAFDGSRPVNLQIVVDNVNVVSAGQSMLIGGAHTMSATFKVIDAASGEVLATNGALATHAGYAPGGLLAVVSEAASRDPVTRMSEGYATNAYKWLTDFET